jgi:methylmalonyl-CoA/ethylmalonyl-CoA epimerase
MKITRLNHIAIAVENLESVATLFQDTLGLKLEYTEEFRESNTRIGMLPVANCEIELVQGLAPSAGAAKWVKQKGQGLYHICLEVEDLDGALLELKRKGVKLIHDEPVMGHGNFRIAFIDRSATGDVLFELAEPPKEKRN